MMKTLVSYMTVTGMGSVVMTHDKPYDIQERIEALMDYISKNYCSGSMVAILSLIPLKDEVEEDV